MRRGRLLVEVSFFDEERRHLRIVDEDGYSRPFQVNVPAGSIVYTDTRVSYSKLVIVVIRPDGLPTCYRDANASSLSWARWLSPLEELALQAE